jgi:hypothetical protein
VDDPAVLPPHPKTLPVIASAMALSTTPNDLVSTMFVNLQAYTKNALDGCVKSRRDNARRRA